MKFIKWKSLISTCLVCLLSVFLGLALWDKLPDSIAIHFNFYNEADNFATKEFAVFGLPFLMVLAQVSCCLITDFNSHKHGKYTKFELVVKWIIPVITIILQIITFAYALGLNVDIRKSTGVIVGIMFIVLGNYIPKLDYVKNYDIDTEKAKKINRFIGFETFILGILMLITVLLPPIATIIWFILLVPYVLSIFIYSVKVCR